MTGREAEAVKKVLDSGFINDGPVTREFERQIAVLCNRQYAVAVPNGTCAIVLALLAAGAKPGDDVIVPDFTYIATANAVRLVGCNVVLADVDEATFCISSKTVDAVRTDKTRFVIAVEINGRLPDYDADLVPYCYAHGIELITDSCEALGTGGHWGIASCFSFSPNKLVTTGQGGMVVTNLESIRNRLLELKQQGLRERGDGGRAKHMAIGYNFKFTDIQAAIGIEQLKELPTRLAQSRQRDIAYRELLGDIDGVKFPRTCGSLWTDILTDHAEHLEGALRMAKVGTRRFWLPMHIQAGYYSNGFPVATEISSLGVWLPSSFDMIRREIVEAADAIKTAMRRVSGRRKMDTVVGG